jgi:hypothetical protein
VYSFDIFAVNLKKGTMILFIGVFLEFYKKGAASLCNPLCESDIQITESLLKTYLARIAETDKLDLPIRMRRLG